MGGWTKRKNARKQAYAATVGEGGGGRSKRRQTCCKLLQNVWLIWIAGVNKWSPCPSGTGVIQAGMAASRTEILVPSKLFSDGSAAGTMSPTPSAAGITARSATCSAPPGDTASSLAESTVCGTNATDRLAVTASKVRKTKISVVFKAGFFICFTSIIHHARDWQMLIS